MASMFEDLITSPRRRSRNPTKSPLAETPSVQRKSTSDLMKKGSLEAPTGGTSPSPAPVEIPLPPPEPAEAVILQEAASSDAPALAEVPAPVAEIAETVEPQEAGSSDTPAPVELALDEDIPKEEEKSMPEEEATLAAAAEPGISEEAERSAPKVEEVAEPPLIIMEPTPVVEQDHPGPALLIGIAGATGSGKSALAQLLSLVLPPGTRPNFIIPQNDFFLSKHYLERNAYGNLDSDCQEAVDSAALLRVLKYAQRMGTLPPDYNDEDEGQGREAVNSFVSQEVVEELKESLAKSGVFDNGRPIGIVYGFSLYHGAEIRDMLDVKLFLRVKKEQARAGRFGKPTYASGGGVNDFWTHEQYFDHTAWPHYVDEHKPLFEKGDVEGTPLFRICDKLGVIMQPQLGMDVEQTLRWATHSIIKAKGRIADIVQDRDIDPEDAFFRKYEECDCFDGWLGRVRKVLHDFV
ncbi:MAG: ribosylnicotinamide kinase [Heterodermia speciosa]|uniref:Ribosylnicotinamide kinase n=1 Tax=Heterodermia speciosa TaxID=116794 RepID=A0A8H3EPH5_9LECA|nr:MAG: ribosylnicotinamide kinase [Heterodermia speciosa]